MIPEGREQGQPERAGLYVHVPFCKNKCPYCDFFSQVAPQKAPAYLDAVCREAELFAAAAGPFDSLYIGGGTPSSLDPGALVRLLDVAGRLLAPGPEGEPEITIELNPADVGPELLDVLREAGVTRLSLGVQSFDDGELKELGRRHDGSRARRAIEEIRRAGFAALGLDLIHALPGSDRASLHRSLEQALAFEPEHLSCYSLTIAAGTPFFELRARAELILPDEDETADQFLETADILGQAGYIHYEVSNFARNDGLRSRHNMKYWRRVPCLGLGPAAHSFDGHRRSWNLRDLDGYNRAIESGRRPLEGFEDLTSEQARLETIALGMRTAEGVALGVIFENPGADENVKRLLAEGLVVESQGRLRPTRSGYLKADGIARLLC
ncbi:MAG TPA: radical SAM family heme chaperone HemW [Myxococcota bacterium]|nr:radical SAM family heme chaperone HemW [Myxococcota bacterium]